MLILLKISVLFTIQAVTNQPKTGNNQNSKPSYWLDTKRNVLKFGKNKIIKQI